MMSPKIRQILYVAGVVLFAALSVMSTYKVIDADVAAQVSAAVTAVLGMFGVTGFGVAAYNVTKQQKTGASDEVSPADQVVNGINAVIAAKDSAQSDLERVKDAVTTAVREVPVLGNLAQQAIDSLTKGAKP